MELLKKFAKIQDKTWLPSQADWFIFGSLDLEPASKLTLNSLPKCCFSNYVSFKHSILLGTFDAHFPQYIVSSQSRWHEACPLPGGIQESCSAVGEVASNKNMFWYVLMEKVNSVLLHHMFRNRTWLRRRPSAAAISTWRAFRGSLGAIWRMRSSTSRWHITVKTNYPGCRIHILILSFFHIRQIKADPGETRDLLEEDLGIRHSEATAGLFRRLGQILGRKTPWQKRQGYS